MIELDAADAISGEAVGLARTTAATVASWPYSFTGFWDGKPIFCMGLHEVDPGRVVAWAIFGDGAGQRMGEIVRGCREMLDILPFRRIELSVEEGYTNGYRLAKVLGFELEGCMRKFDARGRDHLLYSRVT